MLDAGEALLLSCPDDFAIHNQCSGAIVIERGNSQNGGQGRLRCADGPARLNSPRRGVRRPPKIVENPFRAAYKMACCITQVACRMTTGFFA